MASPPLLTAKQFRLIEDDLPATKRDRVMISALLYRASSGQSLRETAEAFGVSRARLHEWECALASELPGIMHALHLEAALPRVQRPGGTGWRRHPDLYGRLQALHLQDFGQALRRVR